MKEEEVPPSSAVRAPGGRGPRPVAAFFLSLAGSSLLLGLLLLTDPSVLELKKGRAEIRELDQRISEVAAENQELHASIEAARSHDFPAEKAAREELHLVRPDELVLLYPSGSLSPEKRLFPPASSPSGKRETPPTPTVPNRD